MGILSTNEMASLAEISPPAGGLRTVWLKGRETLVVSKSRAGFDDACVGHLTALLKSIEDRAYPDLRFLVFDFAHGGGEATRAAPGFADMVAANAELIVDTPVITLAWVRSLIDGLDFDFAMNCSAIVAESGARFSFAGEPFDLFGLYAAVGRRIGFGKVERLIESDMTFSAEEARNLLIVKDVVAAQPGLDGIAAYLMQFERRYNASHAIFRARRMAEPPIDRSRPVVEVLER